MHDKKKKTDWLLLFSLSADDFRGQYAGSLAGAVWAFVHPAATILIYWFIFQVGYHSEPVEGYPFVLWLAAGILPWFFISDGISRTTPVLAEYSYLVKKVLFPMELLPLVRILSGLLVQVFLTAFLVLLFAYLGYVPDVYYLQLPFYMAYTALLLAGIGYCAAALYPFLKDLLQIIQIGLQAVFWMTPIVWDFQRMSEPLQKILALNPFFYCVSGYRNVFIYKEFFWSDWKGGAYYWGTAILFWIAGRKLFRKMKAHFADVL